MMAGKDAGRGGGLKSRIMGMANEGLPETFKAHQAAKGNKPSEVLARRVLRSTLDQLRSRQGRTARPHQDYDR